MTVGVSLCLVAITKSWSGSCTLYLTLISNGACLFAAVIPMGTWALSSCPTKDVNAGPKREASSSEFH